MAWASTGDDYDWEEQVPSAERVAIVTGGTQGIGAAIAHRLLADGLKVVIVGREEARLRAACTAIGPEVLGVQADVSRQSDVAAVVEATLSAHGRIDVLVNNAGIQKFITAETPVAIAEPIWDEVIDVNLKGPFLFTQNVVPHLSSPGGRIINIGSIVAFTGATSPGYIAYTSSKGGIHALTFAFARELGPKGITVNAVAPGAIGETGQSGLLSEETTRRMERMLPLRRIGASDDVAGAVSWLASPDAGYVTGSVISVNGGWVFR